jgi:hypothetical protein
MMQHAADKLTTLLHQITSEGLTATKQRLFNEGALPPSLTPFILFGETDEQRNHGMKIINDIYYDDIGFDIIEQVLNVQLHRMHALKDKLFEKSQQKHD